MSRSWQEKLSEGRQELRNYFYNFSVNLELSPSRKSIKHANLGPQRLLY
jgi:hypothetical protein